MVVGPDREPLTHATRHRTRAESNTLTLRYVLTFFTQLTLETGRVAMSTTTAARNGSHQEKGSFYHAVLSRVYPHLLPLSKYLHHTLPADTYRPIATKLGKAELDAYIVATPNEVTPLYADQATATAAACITQAVGAESSPELSIEEVRVHPSDLASGPPE